MQKQKKLGLDGHRSKKTLQKVLAYLTNKSKSQQMYCQTLSQYLNANDIDLFFTGLENYLSRELVQEEKKNVHLDDGIYILLEGAVTYVWTRNKNDRDRKDHLFSLARAGIYSNFSINNHEKESLLMNGYSILISSPFSVIQSQCGNILTNEDCIFLKISNKILQETGFQNLRHQRLSLFSQVKLPGARNQYFEPIVVFNYNLHHTFKIRRMKFRNKFEISSLGIVANGCANTKLNKSQKKVQFSKYCVLLPNFEYEVSSAQIQIIEITKNPTIIFKKPSLLSQFIQQFCLRSSCQSQNEQKTSLRKYRKKILNSISTHKNKSQKISKNMEEKKKKKQYNMFSKQCQNYCIVSMQFCKQNLNHIKTIKKKALQSEQAEKCKKPRVLFNFSKKQARDKGESDNQLTVSGKHLRYNSSFSGSKSNFMERFSLYSKQIYAQFQKYQGQNKESNSNSVSFNTLRG